MFLKESEEVVQPDVLCVLAYWDLFLIVEGTQVRETWELSLVETGDRVMWPSVADLISVFQLLQLNFK